MSLSKSLASYLDVERAFNASLGGSRATVKFESHAAAIRWRQRAYYFRKLYREANSGRSPWDDFTIKVEGESCILERGFDQILNIKVEGEAPAKPVEDEAWDPADLVKNLEGLKLVE